MESHGLGMEGEFYVESVTSLPAWNSEYEGRFVSFNNGLYYGESSKWVKLQEKSDIEGTVDTDVIHYHPSGNGIAGYVAGGGGGGDTVDKLIFSNDNVASITSTLFGEVGACAGFNSRENGFIAGGTFTVSTIYKLNFSNDNIIYIASLTKTRTNATGFNSQNNGYAAGSQNETSIDKLNFSNDNVARIASKLSDAENNAAGFNSETSGFIAGGSNDNHSSVIDKLNFSNDNVASIISTLSTNRNSTAGFNSQDYGFIAGGSNDRFSVGGSGFTSVIEKLNFSSDSISLVFRRLSDEKYRVEGFNSKVNGFVAGGSLDIYRDTNEIEKLNFSSYSIAQLSSRLSTTRTSPAGFEN